MDHQSLCVLWVPIFLVSKQTQTGESVNTEAQTDTNTLSHSLPSLRLSPVSGLAAE